MIPRLIEELVLLIVCRKGRYPYCPFLPSAFSLLSFPLGSWCLIHFLLFRLLNLTSLDVLVKACEQRVICIQRGVLLCERKSCVLRRLHAVKILRKLID